MIQDKLIKIANEYEDGIERLDVKRSSYNFLMKNITKKFLNELSKEAVVSYIRDYNFSSILNEDGTRINSEIAEKNFQALGYFLFFAAERYGAEFVFNNLLPASTVHISNSKFNPINWLKWIFNKIVWSEINANPNLEQDAFFSEAVEQFKTISAPNDKAVERIDLSKDKDSLQTLNCLIKRTCGEKQRLNELKASAKESRAVTMPNSLVSPTASGNPPPPPPPPPPVSGNTQSASLPPLSFPTTTATDTDVPRATSKETAPNAENNKKDSRSALLDAIKAAAGKPKAKPHKQSKESSEPKDKNPIANDGSGVASILARRVAIATSDTESDASSASGADDEEWDDEKSKAKKQKRLVKEASKISNGEAKSGVGVSSASENEEISASVAIAGDVFKTENPLSLPQSDPLLAAAPEISEVVGEPKEEVPVLQKPAPLTPKPNLPAKSRNITVKVLSSDGSHSDTDSGHQSGSDNDKAKSSFSSAKAKLLGSGLGIFAGAKPSASTAAANGSRPSLQFGAGSS